MQCTKQPCIYCGALTAKGEKGEHVIPNALGGSLTLNDFPNRFVCKTCNTTTLSLIDRELCSRSYVSVVASRELGSHLWNAWDIDYGSRKLLVEAKPLWMPDGFLMRSLAYWPQITFEQTGADVRGDRDEFRSFGAENSRTALVNAARHAYRRYRSGNKRSIFFEMIKPASIPIGCRFAPRLYASRSIHRIAKNFQKQSFVLRYENDRDKEFALYSMRELTLRGRPKKFEETLSFGMGRFGVHFDLEDTLRGLMKIGLNLIAAFCPNTPVNPDTFNHTIKLIRGKAGQMPRALFQTNGFLNAEYLKVIDTEKNSHAFRLIHVNGVWQIYLSFFGDTVGAYVEFPGPNRESWKCANIIAPIRRKTWKINTSVIFPYMPPTKRVVWTGPDIVPSFKLEDRTSFITAEPSRRKDRRSN